MSRKAYFRADGDSRIGLGHIVRCIALADMLRADFHCHFFIQDPQRGLQDLVRTSGAELHILPATQDYAEEANEFSKGLLGNEIVVLDGYRFDTAYQQRIKDRGCKLVCIDDLHNIHFVADAVINHGGGQSLSAYSVEPLTKTYLGPRFAILRSPFLERAASIPRGQEIFICMGGADGRNDTVEVLRLLENRGISLKCKVVVGVAYPHIDSLEAFAKTSGLDIEISRGMDVGQIATLMKSCSYAVCPPSTLSYEYLLVGGELYLRMTAENQSDNLHFLRDTGLAFMLEEFPVLDEDRLANSIAQQAVFFDGKSGQRLKQIFLSLSEEADFTVRRVVENDLQLLYEWASDEEVRRAALNTGKFSLEEHTAWLERKLRDPGAYMYVVSKNGKAVGQVRFDIVGNEAVVSYSIAREYRKRGWGSLVVRIAGKSFQGDSPRGISLKAIVKKENVHSCKVFERLSFMSAAEEIHGESLCNIYTCAI